MTHLRIENQNSNVEIVNAAIILKLYNSALGIEENLLEGESLSDYVSLKGNLLADHAKLSAYDYLTGNLPDSNNKRFPNLTINLTDGAYIDFVDPEVERILLANNIGDGVGVSTIDAAATAIGNIFASNTTVLSFDEFDKFTASQAGNFSFNGCTNLTSINLSNVTAITTNYCFQNVPLETFDAPKLTSFTALIPFGGYENSPKSNLKHVTNLGNITILGKNGSSNLTTFGYLSELLDVNLPTTCIELGLRCFAKCTKLATINLDNILVVGAEAFDCWGGSGKTVLNNVDSSQDLTSITSIGAFGFRGTRLGKTGGTLNLPALTGSIGLWTFAGCPITSITSLGNATSIGDKAFYQCPVLATVSGISNITSIGVDAFKECTALTSIDLSNITSIGGSSFSGCSSLTSITSLSNCTNIGVAAFYNCSNLTINNLDVSGKTIENRAFYGCSKITGTLTIGSNTTLGYGDSRNGSHFHGMGISQVILPSNVTTLWLEMFKGCTLLLSIDLSNVTKIRESAFSGCTSLTHVDLSSVTDIGSNAFSGCTNLGVGETIEITHTAATTYPANAFAYTKYIRLILHMSNVTTYDVRYPVWEHMNQLQYIDASDCVWTTCGSLYGNTLLETYILPASLVDFEYRLVLNLPNLLYFIILAETPPTGTLTVSFFLGSNGGSANIYVKDSTVRDVYLADAVWGAIPNASTRIKTLAELPVGIWKTGLYQLYEPYLSNSTDPAYATT